MLWTTRSSGIAGLAIGGLVFAVASLFKNRIPLLIEGGIGVGIVFLVLLLMALAEIPVMVWALRRMVRDASTPRAVVLGTHVVYNSFAAVYAAAFVLVTGRETLGLVLAGVGLLRFITGIWIR